MKIIFGCYVRNMIRSDWSIPSHNTIHPVLALGEEQRFSISSIIALGLTLLPWSVLWISILRLRIINVLILRKAFLDPGNRSHCSSLLHGSLSKLLFRKYHEHTLSTLKILTGRWAHFPACPTCYMLIENQESPQPLIHLVYHQEQPHINSAIGREETNKLHAPRFSLLHFFIPKVCRIRNLSMMPYEYCVRRKIIRELIEKFIMRPLEIRNRIDWKGPTVRLCIVNVFDISKTLSKKNLRYELVSRVSSLRKGTLRKYLKNNKRLAFASTAW